MPEPPKYILRLGTSGRVYRSLSGYLASVAQYGPALGTKSLPSKVVAAKAATKRAEETSKKKAKEEQEQEQELQPIVLDMQLDAEETLLLDMDLEAQPPLMLDMDVEAQPPLILDMDVSVTNV